MITRFILLIEIHSFCFANKSLYTEENVLVVHILVFDFRLFPMKEDITQICFCIFADRLFQQAIEF